MNQAMTLALDLFLDGSEATITPPPVPSTRITTDGAIRVTTDGADRVTTDT